MKWNATTTTAACLAVGVGGFVIGKISGGSGSGGSETDELIDRARQVSSERVSAGTDVARPRRAAAGRSARAGAVRSTATFDERLSKMEEIVCGENALDRNRAMLSWIYSLAPDEFESAVDRFRILGVTEARMGEYAMLLTAWAEHDPTSALAYAKEKTGGSMATDTLLTAWASRDPESAIAWAEANHENEGANPYMIGIIRGLMGSNPARATDLLQGLPFGRERSEALNAMMPHLLQMGGEGAKDWIRSLGDEKLRDSATARFAGILAKQDPAGTAKWLMANLGDASSQIVDQVYGEWAKVDKGAAISSFAQLPGGDARANALRGLVANEARDNPQAAANLMNSYPADVDDRTLSHFVWSSFDKAPDVAADQIGRIGNKGYQIQMYQRTLATWLSRDPSAARRWINSATLPEPVLRSLANRSKP